MSMDEERRAAELDRALETGSSHTTDPELGDIARELQTQLMVEPPRAGAERALFVEAVRGRHSGVKWSRALAPMIVAALLLALVAFVSRGALPGESLYPVREVLGNFGLARSPIEEARALVARARSEVELAEDIEDDDPSLARELASGAIGKLASAGKFLADVRGEPAEELADEIQDLQEDAVDVLNDVEEALNEAGDLPEDDDSSGPGSGDDDNSGSGNGDDDESDDNSGPGSDDDDNSGSGGDDDSGDDDNSGSGSGDDSDDDKSGSGGGGDDSGGDDNSGSGGGGDDSDSGGDDSD